PAGPVAAAVGQLDPEIGGGLIARGGGAGTGARAGTGLLGAAAGGGVVLGGRRGGRVLRGGRSRCGGGGGRPAPADRLDQLALAQATGSLDAALDRDGLQLGKLLRREVCAGGGVVHPGSFLSSRSRRLSAGLGVALHRERHVSGCCRDRADQGY